VRPTFSLLLFLFAGCTPWSSRTPIDGPSGPEWLIRCHRDDVGCYQQAHAACPEGYVIAEQQGAKYFRIVCKGESGPRQTVVRQ
jgi:hypothetical protein